MMNRAVLRSGIEAFGRFDALSVARCLGFVGVLMLAWISLRPFQDLSGLDLADHTTGNEQLTYMVFASLAVLGLAYIFAYHLPALKALAAPRLIALTGWIMFSVTSSQDMSTSLRRFVLTACVAIVAAALFLLPQSRTQFRQWLQVPTLAVLLLSYAGFILVPHLTIHQATDFLEPLLAGAWRGVFGHKNVAAAVIAMFVFIGCYVARAGGLVAGLSIILLSAVFLIFSEGKSATALCLGVLALTALAPRIRSFWSRAAVLVAPVLLLNLLGVGVVLFDGLADLAKLLPFDATFTGRTDIWRFTVGAVAEHPFKGFGFSAFWGGGAVRGLTEDGTSWAGVAAHSHNGYLDATVTMGLPALGLIIVALIYGPLRDFHIVHKREGDDPLALLLLRLWLFGIYLSAMESFFFDRADPIWFTFLFAVFGLRFLARFRTAG